MGKEPGKLLSEDRIKIVTQNTTGSECVVTDITESSFNFTWNPDSPNAEDHSDEEEMI